MAVKKRCFFCHKHLREDGTCQTSTCPLYVPEPTPEPQPEPTPTEPNEKETK